MSNELFFAYEVTVILKRYFIRIILRNTARATPPSEIGLLMNNILRFRSLTRQKFREAAIFMLPLNHRHTFPSTTSGKLP